METIFLKAVVNRVRDTRPARVAQWWAVSDLWPGGCEFDTRLRQTFCPAYFRLSPLLKPVRKVVGGFEKKVVLALVSESHETHMRHRAARYDLSC